MPNGTCRKKETFEYFHWTGEQDNEALLDWLVENQAFLEDYLSAQGHCVWITDGEGNLENIEFDMKKTPYFVMNEDYEVIEATSSEFNSFYEELP